MVARSADSARAALTHRIRERARAALAKMLLGRANLVMLDEPTNDLDVSALAALESMLLEFDGSALVVTHDRWFLDRVATSILAFEDGGKVVHYPGSYEVYRAIRAQQEAARLEAESEAAANATSTSASRAEPDAKRREAPPAKTKLTWAETKELDGIMDHIGTAELEVARLEAELADPALYATEGANVKERLANLDGARGRLTTLMSRWEELETKKNASGSG